MRSGDARQSLLDSVQNERICEQSAAEILGLRQLESVARERGKDGDLENSELVRAVIQSGVTERQIQSIRRLRAAPITGDSYKQENIQISLQAVTVEQIIRCMLQIEENSGAPRATQLRMVAAPSTDSTHVGKREDWNMELVLTQLVFVATSGEQAN